MSESSLLQYVRERLPTPSEKDRLEEVAKGADVPYHTLLKIAKGETEDPKVSTVQKLYDYLKGLEARAAA